MFLESLILGVAIGLARRGRLSNISYMKIKGWIFIIIAFLLQVLPMFSADFPLVKTYGKHFYIASMVIIILILIMNLDKKGFRIILLGTILNFVVVFMNGFKMPIYFEGLRLAGLESMIEGINNGQIINYMDLNNVTNWTKYLSKFIVLPKPYPLAKVISIGDVLISLGIILFIQGEMIKSYFTAKGRMIKLGYKVKL